MNLPEYEIEWTKIDSLFLDSYKKGLFYWKDQQKFLSKQIKKSFKLKDIDIYLIFEHFNSIFSKGK